MPGVEHAAVVLVRRDDLVAGLRSMPSCAICSASLALRVIAISSGSQPNAAARRRRTLSMLRLEHLPHVVDGRLVRDVEVALHRLLHDARARAEAAVVEVDDACDRA